MNFLHDSLRQPAIIDSNEQRLFDNKILQVQEVAEMLGVSKGHIYNLTSRREIPFYKKGKRGRLYFRAKEVFDWVYEENV